MHDRAIVSRDQAPGVRPVYGDSPNGCAAVVSVFAATHGLMRSADSRWRLSYQAASRQQSVHKHDDMSCGAKPSSSVASVMMGVRVIVVVMVFVRDLDEMVRFA